MDLDLDFIGDRLIDSSQSALLDGTWILIHETNSNRARVVVVHFVNLKLLVYFSLIITRIESLRSSLLEMISGCVMWCRTDCLSNFKWFNYSRVWINGKSSLDLVSSCFGVKDCRQALDAITGNSYGAFTSSWRCEMELEIWFCDIDQQSSRHWSRGLGSGHGIRRVSWHLRALINQDCIYQSHQACD